MIKNIKKLGRKLENIWDRDSELKICLQPGLEAAQKGEKHCVRGQY